MAVRGVIEHSSHTARVRVRGTSVDTGHDIEAAALALRDESDLVARSAGVVLRDVGFAVVVG